MVCSLQTCQASAHAEGSVRAPFTNTSRAFDSSNAASPTYELLQLGHWRVSFSTYTVRTRPLAGSATQLNDEHPDTCDGCTERATGYTNHRKGVRYQRTHVYPGGCSGLVRLLRCTHGACDTAARSGGASPSPTRSRCHFSASNHSLLRVHHPTSTHGDAGSGRISGLHGDSITSREGVGSHFTGLGTRSTVRADQARDVRQLVGTGARARAYERLGLVHPIATHPARRHDGTARVRVRRRHLLKKKSNSSTVCIKS
jgi:hypothetical protein